MTDATDQMVLRAEYWPVEKLVPYARNPRKHSEEQINQIAASIVEVGFLNPILIDASANVLAGHGRLMAAKKLGWPKVPVVIFDHLTEAQKHFYIIADNQLALNAEWEKEDLNFLLDKIAGEGTDLSLLGFTDEELAEIRFYEEETEGNTDDNAVPEAPTEPETKPGDIYVLGNHRLLCGDSTVLANVEKVLDGALADMVFTDPPYNVDYGNTAKDKLRGNDRRIMNDNARLCLEACSRWKAGLAASKSRTSMLFQRSHRP